MEQIVLNKGKVELVKSAKNEFDLWLVDENGHPISLTPYVGGKLIFKNCDGVKTEITLTVPGLNPDAGRIPVTITKVQADNMDDNWASADLELDDGSPDPVVVLFNDYFEIQRRNA